MLDLLLKATDDIEQAEAEKTVAALLQKIAGAGQPRRAWSGAADDEKDAAARAKLIGLLRAHSRRGRAAGAAHGRSRTPNPASRTPRRGPSRRGRRRRRATTCCSWCGTAKDETHRLLAFAGLVRLVGLDA